MEIQELDKKQLVLLTLLITFVVSIATGIITVSFMNKAPASVPQTINNVIQRTIEKVTTIPQQPAVTTSKNQETKSVPFSGDSLIYIYPSKSTDPSLSTPVIPATDLYGKAVVTETKPQELKALGQGIIISDMGLVLVDTDILTEGDDVYKVILQKTDFDAKVVKRYKNGFTILQISNKK